VLGTCRHQRPFCPVEEEIPGSLIRRKYQSVLALVAAEPQSSLSGSAAVARQVGRRWQGPYCLDWHFSPFRIISIIVSNSSSSRIAALCCCTEQPQRRNISYQVRCDQRVNINVSDIATVHSLGTWSHQMMISDNGRFSLRSNFSTINLIVSQLLPRGLCRRKMSVCPSVRPSHAGNLSKRLNWSSNFFRHRVATPF